MIFAILIATISLAAPLPTGKKLCTSTVNDKILLDFLTGEAMVNNIHMNLTVRAPEYGATMDLLLTPSRKSPPGYFVTYHLQEWNSRGDGYATMQQQGYGRDIGPVAHFTCRKI